MELKCGFISILNFKNFLGMGKAILGIGYDATARATPNLSLKLLTRLWVVSGPLSQNIVLIAICISVHPMPD